MINPPLDNKVVQLTDYFRLLEIDINEINIYNNAFDRLRSEDIDGILIHNVYSKDILDVVVDRLENNQPGFLRTWFPREFNSWFYGRNLNLTDPELQGYFEEAEKFHQDLDELLPPEHGIRTYLANILSQLDNGRPFIAPPGPDEQPYMFTTLRCHMENGFIPPHIDYEYIRRRSYHHLRTLIQPQIISFVLTFTVPPHGGTLDIFNQQADKNIQNKPGQVNQDHDINHVGQVSIPFAPGSLCIFNSSQHLHGVSPVIGDTKRWTACSFMALSKDNNAMYCWG